LGRRDILTNISTMLFR